MRPVRTTRWTPGSVRSNSALRPSSEKRRSTKNRLLCLSAIGAGGTPGLLGQQSKEPDCREARVQEAFSGIRCLRALQRHTDGSSDGPLDARSGPPSWRTRRFCSMGIHLSRLEPPSFRSRPWVPIGLLLTCSRSHASSLPAISGAVASPRRPLFSFMEGSTYQQQSTTNTRLSGHRRRNAVL